MAKTEETKAAPKPSSARVVPLEKMKAKEGTGKGENELSEASIRCRTVAVSLLCKCTAILIQQFMCSLSYA